MHLFPVLTDFWPGGGGQDDGPALRDGLEESDISPGIEGFLFTALVVVLLVFVIRDLVKRMRRMKYRAQFASEAEGDEPGFPGEVTAAQISEAQQRAREAAAADRFGQSGDIRQSGDTGHIGEDEVAPEPTSEEPVLDDPHRGRTLQLAMTAQQRLESLQVWVLLAAVGIGLLLGLTVPELFTGASDDAPGLGEGALWPLLAALLFVTFTQTPLTRIPQAFTQARFLLVAVVGNFLVLPMAAYGLTRLVLDDDPVRLGLLLVLLVPCTDWFITFIHLGRGDSATAAALTPLNLIAQLILLPVYLAVMVDHRALTLEPTAVLAASAVVLVPLLAAVLSEPLLRRAGPGERLRAGLGWLPVPLLAVVVVLVVGTHAEQVLGAVGLIPRVAVVVGGFLLVAVMTAVLLGAVARLEVPARRTLAFTFSTRNSFLVLPLALALPAGWELAAVVIVMQALMELLALILLLRVVPDVVFRSGHLPVT